MLFSKGSQPFKFPTWPGIQHFLSLCNCKYLPAYLICSLSKLRIWPASCCVGLIFHSAIYSQRVSVHFFPGELGVVYKNTRFCSESVLSVKLVRGHVEIKELLRVQVHTQEHRPVASWVGKDFEPPFKSLDVPDDSPVPVIWQ